MADVILQRGTSSDDGTPGRWTVQSDGWACDTLELPDRGNAIGLSRIDSGTYNLDLLWSDHFHRLLYHVMDVPGRAAIEVHPGNWAGDVAKGKFSQVHGCALQGKGYAKISPHLDQLAILHSLVTVDAFILRMDGKPFTLEILD